MGYKLSKIRKVSPIEPQCKKAMYNTPEEAQDMVSYIKENRGIQKIDVYKCTVCGFWHLTSKSK